ncbi:hypothetical protein LTR09_007618 [Extremus antarcticus]|uniref:Uncharacterized protein n=1 Tax=Extremus antarcticus TaxID=702011 RepID=A0AAJ0GCW0_9PEZI|nr:hypothetical protein LTR09_007618 [Extremus antarcticus]
MDMQLPFEYGRTVGSSSLRCHLAPLRSCGKRHGPVIPKAKSATTPTLEHLANGDTPGASPPPPPSTPKTPKNEKPA